MPVSYASPLTRSAPRGRRRRRRLLGRTLPMVAIAVAAFAAGAVVGAGGNPDRDVIERFAAAWARGDFPAMHQLLSPGARRRASFRRFARTYQRAADTATVQRMVPAGEAVERADRRWQLPVVARTRSFGDIRGSVELALEGDGDATGVGWRADDAFPGLRPGERLRRTVRLPRRAALQARDGTRLAEGETRSSDLGPLAAEIAGRVGPIPPEQAAAYARRGYPPDATVGLTGLEREFEERLAGTAGGSLLAGRRVLARRRPLMGQSVRTSIDPGVQRAAVEALAGRFGGVAVLLPRSGEVLALAGIAYSAPQPPGSTFKIVTLAGALQNGVVGRNARFPVQTSTTLEGVKVENANGEACGGTLGEAFAHSCNSVFAPLGAKLGARRLVAAAERFGFNETPALAGAAPSTIPKAGEIGDDLAVGSTAIGQGKVLATPLLMAAMAATVANRGVYHRPTLLRGARTRSTRVVSTRVARTIDRFMRLVVRGGTGVGAQIPGVVVAGKTGTAELRSTVSEDPVPGETPPEEQKEEDKTDTDAWFVAYAPASRPRVAVAVLLVAQGAGGETAAPAARQVLLAGLKR